MKCRILHESRGRMRVRMLQRRMTIAQADKLHYYLQAQSGITKVTVSDRTMDVTILYEEKEGIRTYLQTASITVEVIETGHNFDLILHFRLHNKQKQGKQKQNKCSDHP